MFDIQEELKKLPSKPGVYIMHDEKDAIIYVGKAISLKNRVRQYFQDSRTKSAKIQQMVTHISRFEYIVTDSFHGTAFSTMFNKKFWVLLRAKSLIVI